MSSPWDRSTPASKPAAPRPTFDRAEQSRNEIRLYGVNAVRAVFAHRPDAIRKVYLLQTRVHESKDLLSWCVTNKIGYRIVESDELQRLCASQHHEGIAVDVRKVTPLTLDQWLAQNKEGSVCAIWLDGIGNPHNLGAILRSAANFGVQAVLVPNNGSITLSGAAARVAEGGAEFVSFVQVSDMTLTTVQKLRNNGFTTIATVVEGGVPLFAQTLPERSVLVMGAEGEGMNRALAEQCDQRVTIPGTGNVESLNVASATAVLLSQWAMRHLA